ncbi:MAG: hypothetical protein ABSE16_15295 [Verrucomicrobiota bacterium]
MRSWRPRRPSAGLKQRIFAAAPKRSPMTWFMGSLAPVATCALLSLVILNSGNGISPGPRRAGALAAMMASNVDASDSLQSEQNRLFTVSFDSTNPGLYSSSIRYTPLTKPTN